MNRVRTVSAFTLVELMIVVAIIAILISILLPSLSAARSSAKRTQCLTQLRSIFQGTTAYLMQGKVFPPLNNEQDEGAWQYNYVLYDGKDFNHNFGPLYKRGFVGEIQQLFCPVQQDLFHRLDSPFNSWPEKPNTDTRTGYARRHDLSGKSFSRLGHSTPVMADLLHLPKVVRSGHATGVNAAFADGHGRWVPDRGIFTKNELDRPFDPLDNPVMEEIWIAVEEGD